MTKIYSFRAEMKCCDEIFCNVLVTFVKIERSNASCSLTTVFARPGIFLSLYRRETARCAVNSKKQFHRKLVNYASNIYTGSRCALRVRYITCTSTNRLTNSTLWKQRSLNHNSRTSRDILQQYYSTANLDFTVLQSIELLHGK